MNLPVQPHLYIYNRFKDRLTIKPENIPFYFFGSSSNGNSVYLKLLHTIIDLGFPYAKYKRLNPNFFLYVDYIFLTHEHSDHLNPATLCKVLKMYPNVKIIISEALYTTLSNPNDNRLTKSQKQLIVQKYHTRFIITNQPQLLQTRQGIKFQYVPHITEHGDILNLGIELLCDKYNLKFLYASDLDTLGPGKHSHAHGLSQDPQHKYNLLLLEANYDKDKLMTLLRDYQHAEHNAKISNQQPDVQLYHNKAYRAMENLRHISEQEAWQYVQTHLSNHGWFVPLHASTTFGTLIQNLK